MRAFRISFLVLGIAATAFACGAQQIRVVDSQGGGQFTDIPAAIAGSGPGDILVVRPGNYSPFRLSKALRIVGDPGARIVVSGTSGGDFIVVTGLPAGSFAVVRGFELAGGLVQQVSVVGNAGHVHLEGLSASVALTCQISTSRQVSVHACLMYSLATTNSDAVLTEDSCAGGGLVIDGGRVIVAGGTYTAPVLYPLAAPAIVLRAGRLTLTGDGTTTVTAGGVSPASAIQADNGELIVDPLVLLQPLGSAPPITGNAVVRSVTVPYLRTAVGGGVLTTRLRATPATIAVVLASPISPPLPLPTMDVWIGTNQILLAVGAVPPTGIRSDNMSLPGLPPGSTAPVQSVTIAPTGFALSNPVLSRLD